MAKSRGYAAVAHETQANPSYDIESSTPREWHGGLLNCCGLCIASNGPSSNALGAYTAIVTHYFPCVTFGLTMNRFGRSAIRNALLVFTLMLLSWAHYATQAAFVVNECIAPATTLSENYVVDHAQRGSQRLGGGIFINTYIEHQGSLPSARHQCAKVFGQPLKPTFQSERCEQLINVSMVLNFASLIWFLMLVCYGAARRTEMRERFNIKGSRFGDFCRWLWCMPCAMCQESRTLEVNNVEDGVWHGHDGLPVLSAADMTQPPAAVRMSANHVEPLSQSEHERATLKL